MGLCKCPKRKVTNLFCFEHRVNVCEHCLVSNHNKVGDCVVVSHYKVNVTNLDFGEINIDCFPSSVITSV